MNVAWVDDGYIRNLWTSHAWLFSG